MKMYVSLNFMLKTNMLILCVDLAKLTYDKNNQTLYLNKMQYFSC